MIAIAIIGWIAATVFAMLWRRERDRMKTSAEQVYLLRGDNADLRDRLEAWTQRAVDLDRQNGQLCAIVDELREQRGRVP